MKGIAMYPHIDQIKNHFRTTLQAVSDWGASGGDQYLVNANYRTLCDIAGFFEKYWEIDFEWAFRDIVAAQKTLSDALFFTAFMLKYRRQANAAALVAQFSRDLDGLPYTATTLADLRRENGDIESSRQLCSEIHRQHPELPDIQTSMILCEVQEQLGNGDDYYSILDAAHRLVKPEVYVEIGVSNGKSLALARAATRALGIDPATAAPELLVFRSPENIPQLYKVTSDDFFDHSDVPQEMGKQTFDMAFIDGLHVFEQALRDFVNLERYASKDSVIFIHDCLPVNALVAERERQTMFWTGDVWKVIPCLRELRPDLEITTFPALPSGLAMVRNLDPTSTTLSRHFDSIVESFVDRRLPDSKEERFSMLNVRQDITVETIQKMLAR